MLNGMIYITNDINVVYDTQLKNVKIVSLDEDNILPEDINIIGGTCLLPPMEAKIAEADGNEQMYDMYYSQHLLLPNQQHFIAALISFLYKGGNLLLFLPELGYTNTTEKFIQHLFQIFGIHPGLIGSNDPKFANCFYDTKCIPIWLNLIYTAGVISGLEYLYDYPVDASISNDSVINQLLMEINPFGNSLNEKIQYINRLHKLIHINPNIVPAIKGV